MPTDLTPEEIKWAKCWLEHSPSMMGSIYGSDVVRNLLAAYERQKAELARRVDYATKVREQSIEIRRLQAALGGEDD